MIGFFLEPEGRQASAKAHEADDHMASFPSSREEILQPGIEPPTSSLRFGYLSTIIQQFRVVLDHILVIVIATMVPTKK